VKTWNQPGELWESARHNSNKCSKHETSNSYSNIEVQTRCTCYRVYFIWRLIYMFRVSLSPIFRSTKQLQLLKMG